MKTKLRSIVFLALVFVCIIPTMKAQDIIYLKNGSRLGCRVSNIEGPKVKYKMLQNLKGPDYVIPKSRMELLFYENGTCILFDPTVSLQGYKEFEAEPQGYDRILTPDKKLMSIDIEQEDRDVIKYRNAYDDQARSQSMLKSDVLLILRADGSHEMMGEPNDVAATLKVAKIVGEGSNAAAIPVVDREETAPIRETVVVDETPDPVEESRIDESPVDEGRMDETVAEVDNIPTNDNDDRGDISNLDLNQFNEKALDRVADLGRYFSIIADKETPWQEANDAIDLAVDLFISEEAQVEVSSTNSTQKRQYPIRKYLERLKLLKYDQVEISWSEIQYVSNLKKGPDGNYYGIVTFQQRFTGYRDGRAVYSDVTKKNIEVVLKGYTKDVAGVTEELWDVFLSDIGVENTRRG